MYAAAASNTREGSSSGSLADTAFTELERQLEAQLALVEAKEEQRKKRKREKVEQTEKKNDLVVTVMGSNNDNESAVMIEALPPSGEFDQEESDIICGSQNV